MVSRRHVLGLAGALAGAATLAGPTAVATARPRNQQLLVQDGRPLGHVLTEPDAPAAVIAAADELVGYVERSTGARLPRQAGTGIAVYVGYAGPGADPAIPGELADLAPDGYLIRSHRSTVTIIGATPTGTVHGVRGFLESAVGVRWLLPGAVGEDVPRQADLAVDGTPVRAEPAFPMRSLSPLLDQRFPIQREWARRNRLTDRLGHPIAFHHNLHTLFPVERYGTTHPEYYPRGVPPKPGVTTGWQPAFSVPGTIDAAVTGIGEYLAANPTVTTFSLGVNDGEGYAEADPVPAYYGWVNQVVERVLATRPGITFGLLAYHKLETPPDFALHPNVVPFLTQDRYTWADPTTRAAGRALSERWQQVAARLGYYDYLYGAPYLLPRVFPRTHAETLRYARQVGVVAHYAELYPNWGEGPKPWLTARLMWDPEADVEVLLTEWYRRAVGPAAAPDLAAYFDLWERFWTELVPTGSWFSPTATYQPFNLPGYLDQVQPADLDRSRTLIDSVLAKADTPERTARATVLRRMYEFYEASARSYPKPTPAPADQAAAESLLRSATDTFGSRVVLAKRRLDLITEFAADPVMIMPWNPASIPNLVWTGWNASEFWGLAGYLRRSEPDGGPVTDLAGQLAAGHPDADGRRYAELILTGSRTTDKVINPSFEAAELTPWRLLPRSTGTRSISRVSGAGRTGTAFLRVAGQGWGGPSQVIDIDPGLAELTAYYRHPGGQPASVQLALDLFNAAGTMIPGSSVRSPVSYLRQSDDWQRLLLQAEIPATAKGQSVSMVDVIILIDSAGEIAVDLDDLQLLTVATQ